MTTENKSAPSLSETADTYLATIQSGMESATVEIRNFVRWFGPDKLPGQLGAPDIGAYAEKIAASCNDPQRRLTPVRGFLAYLHKQKWTVNNLSKHLTAKKSAGRSGSPPRPTSDPTVCLTLQGHDELKRELEKLISERPKIAEELEKARADRDFRENAPLDAAREHQAQVEARIRELNSILKTATIMETPQQVTSRIGMGDTVWITELNSGDEVCYTLVNTREANPMKGKISTISPTGKSLLGKAVGETIEVPAPAGVVCYRISRISYHNSPAV
jgi:transcription elongation factor GreA